MESLMLVFLILTKKNEIISYRNCNFKLDGAMFGVVPRQFESN
jgi:hypothetical protein